MERTGFDAEGHPIVVEWADGTLRRVERPEGAMQAAETRPRRVLAPGLVDIQVNGYAGVSVNADDIEPEPLLHMARAIWATGAAIFFPTVTTGSRERMRRSIRTIRDAASQDARFAKAAAGIHVEGPFISPEDGPRGAHPREHVRPPDWDEFRRWQDAADGTVRLVTLSPEWPEAPTFIERVVKTGVLIAIGHTKATAAQLDAAVKAGARLSTHLGNGAHATLPRHPNYLWDQLGDDRLWASFIADGHHLPPKTLKAMVRAKTLARTVFTSDAVWVAGVEPGHYEASEGKALDVLPNGRVQLAGTPYLAGAGLPLITGVENGVRFVGLALRDALRVATTNPAQLLGIPHVASMTPGTPANVMCAEWDPERASLNVVETILEGETVFHA